MIEVCCNEEDYKHRGLILLQNAYFSMWTYILNNQDAAKTFSVSFGLINEISYDLWLAIKEIPIDVLEKHIDLIELGENVLRVESWICPSIDTIKRTGEQLNDMIRLTVMNSAKRAPWNIKSGKWLKPLQSPFISLYNVPSEYGAIFAKRKAELYFHYTLGLILGGRMDAVKESLYLVAYNHSFQLGKELLEVAFALQCYIYYLAEWETTKCVSIELIEESKRFLSDNEVKYMYGCVMERLTLQGLLKAKLNNRTFGL